MTTRSIKELIDQIAGYGVWPEALTADERKAVIDYTLGFEECQHFRAELVAMTDEELAHYSYWVMAEYAQGQL